MVPDQESDPVFVYLNDRLVPAAEASISLFDHGLLYGDGLFETIRVANGRCFRPHAHFDRLETAAARLSLSLPWDRRWLLEALAATAEANRLGEGALRLTVTRGPGSPIPDPGACPEPTCFITARRTIPVSAEAFERGLRLCVGPPHPRLFVPGLKTLCFLPYQQARVIARSAGCDDALLTWAGQVVETGTSNLFLVRDGRLITPHLESGCLPGTTRRLLLELALRLGVPTEERAVAIEELRTASELMVTNSVLEVMPVREVVGVVATGSAGPVTRALAAAYRVVLNQETA